MIPLENVSADALCAGVQEADGAYTCAYCGARFERGEVYAVDGRFFDAHRAAELHSAAHGDKLERLFEAGGKALSLTENQKMLLTRFAEGMRDSEIAALLGVSPSTVRHQRFVLRERARAAKLYLAVWTIAENGKAARAEEKLLQPHEGAKMVDERYEITEAEEQKILENVFESLEPLRLKVFSKKEKKKLVILRRVAAQFAAQRMYTEKEVNAVLAEIWADYATMRRYLIEYGYLDRTADGSAYWKK